MNENKELERLLWFNVGRATRLNGGKPITLYVREQQAAFNAGYRSVKLTLLQRLALWLKG